MITIYECIENQINTSEITVNSALANKRTEGRVLINVVTTIPEVVDIIQYFSNQLSRVKIIILSRL